MAGPQIQGQGELDTGVTYDVRVDVQTTGFTVVGVTNALPNAIAANHLGRAYVSRSRPIRLPYAILRPVGQIGTPGTFSGYLPPGESRLKIPLLNLNMVNICFVVVGAEVSYHGVTCILSMVDRGSRTAA